VTKLHAHVYKGAMLSAVLKKRADASGPVAAAAKPQAAANRGSRLIVRNLPWDAGEQDLRALFLPFGPIHAVHVPSTTAEDGTPRGRGFAFVWMLSKADAARALAGVNGTKVRAGLAARLAEEKNKKKKDARLERKKEGAEGDADDAAAKERVVAVDWALSKDRWEEEKTKAEEAGEDTEMDEAEASGSGSGSSSSSEEGDSDDEDGGLGVDDEDSDQDADSGSDDDDERDEADAEAPVKPTLPQTDVGTTLFVRNVPYEATEDDLRQLYALHRAYIARSDPSLQLQDLRSPPLRPDHPRARDGARPRHRLRVLLEQGGRRSGTRVLRRAQGGHRARRAGGEEEPVQAAVAAHAGPVVDSGPDACTRWPYPRPRARGHA
jgi:nucleolar protein 4